MINTVKVKKQKIARVVQGDILKDIVYYEKIDEANGDLTISKIIFPLVIVLTQDCDLMQDFTSRFGRPVKAKRKNEDKFLFSSLVAPIYNYDHVVKGEHLIELGRTMTKIDSKTKTDMIRNNEIPRYHYLCFSEDIKIVPSIIDFKHYFSIPIENIKKQKGTHFVCRISELYREKISQRFSYYLSRIGLPE